MLATEVYYHNHRWWFEVVGRGPLGQTLDVLIRRRCESHRDARSQAVQALEHMRSKADAS